MNIFDNLPTYEEWCEANGFDQEDDNNWISYQEWKNNS